MTQRGKPDKAAKKGSPGEAEAVQVVLVNRKLRHDYHVIDTWEAGMALQGSEVKSLRAGDMQWGDAHARMDGGELFLYGLHIGEYRQANTFGHEPRRPRKLLLNRRELDRIVGQIRSGGMTIIPERIHFRRGFAKAVIALAKGKTRGDKRVDLEKRAAKRDVEREISRRSKG